MFIIYYNVTKKVIIKTDYKSFKQRDLMAFFLWQLIRSQGWIWGRGRGGLTLPFFQGLDTLPTQMVSLWHYFKTFIFGWPTLKYLQKRQRILIFAKAPKDTNFCKGAKGERAPKKHAIFYQLFPETAYKSLFCPYFWTFARDAESLVKIRFLQWFMIKDQNFSRKSPLEIFLDPPLSAIPQTYFQIWCSRTARKINRSHFFNSTPCNTQIRLIFRALLRHRKNSIC